MKAGFIYICCVGLLGFTACKTPGKLAAPASQFSFLTGDWVTAPEDGVVSYQSWRKSKKGNLQANSCAVQRGRDTISRDAAELLIRDGAFYYVPYTDEGHKLAIPYRITTYTDTTFTAENTAHSFPKRFQYKLKSKDQMSVIIDNGPGKKGDRFIFNYRRK